MKFKKNITRFLCFISLFVFIFGFSNNILVNAVVFLDYEFSHAYYNPVRDLISINASTKFFYNSKYNSSDFTLPNTIRLMVGKIGYTSNTDVFRQYIFNFDYFEIKEYNNNIYIYIPSVNYEVGSCTHDLSSDTYSSSIIKSGFTSMGYKALIKINPDFSTLKIASFDSFINTVSSDDFILDDLSGSISYYEYMSCFNVFYEYQSTFNIKGETFQNNADIQNPLYYGTVLSDKKQFIDWIIDNEKYTVFGDYGIEKTALFVDDIVNLYETYQKNPFKLFLEFPKFMFKNGSVFATVDKAKELMNYVSALYQEFKLERRPVIYEPELMPYIFPQPWVDDSPNEKYVDNVQDTVEIGLLREILRAIIVTPQNVFNFFDYYIYNISVNTSLLADYVAQLPAYMTELLYYRFAPLFSDSGGFDTSELQDFLLYLFNPTYDSFDEIDIILKDKFDLTELEQFLLLEENLNHNLLNENDTELIQLGNVVEGGEGGTQTIYPSFKFTLPVSNLTKVPLELKLIDFDKFSIAITAFKGIFSVVIIFFFIRWLIRFFPKVLSGY